MSVRIHVDEGKCRRHGQCVIAAPKLFSFAADGRLKYVEQPDEALRNDAMDAEDVCPEQAISVWD